ncbi:hypothetical protein CBL_02853 [Carabus blaptoides fortunei]
MPGSHRSQRAKYDNVIAVDKMKLYIPSGGISDNTGDEEYYDVSNDLGEATVEKYAERRNPSTRRSKTPKPTRLVERHFPSIIPQTAKAKPTKRCYIYYKKGIRKESRYWCEDYIPPPCFKTYHAKE